MQIWKNMFLQTSQMKNDTPTPTLNIFSVFFLKYLAKLVEGLGFVFSWLFFALLEDAHAFGALGNLPGAPTADLTMSPPTSIAAAPSVPSRNNGSSSRILHHRALARADLTKSAILTCQDVSC